jgi:cytochrome o ubiquinol oxidase operon protein cyoD
MATFKSYLFGFMVALALTLAAYFAVVRQVPYALAIIIGCAIIQLFAQLVFFLHLGEGRSAKLKWASFSFTLLVIAIVVGGSLWIMNNLNYNMTPQEMNAKMIDLSE